jgi:hypothetical protein
MLDDITIHGHLEGFYFSKFLSFSFICSNFKGVPWRGGGWTEKCVPALPPAHRYSGAPINLPPASHYRCALGVRGLWFCPGPGPGLPLSLARQFSVAPTVFGHHRCNKYWVAGGLIFGCAGGSSRPISLFLVVIMPLCSIPYISALCSVILFMPMLHKVNIDSLDNLWSLVFSLDGAVESLIFYYFLLRW